MRCFDSIGSWTDIFIQTIVNPAPAEVIAALAAGMLNYSNKILLIVFLFDFLALILCMVYTFV